MTERTPAQDTVLRFALRAVLLHPQGLAPLDVEALTQRLASIEDSRASLVLTPAERAQLIPLVLQWADQLRPDVGQVLRQAFGEETTATRWKETPWKPGEAPRGQRQQHSQETRAMILMSESPEVTSRNGTVAMEEVFGLDSKALQELHIQRELMDCPPFNSPMKKLVDAFKCIERGRVQEAEGVANVWLVQGSKGDPYRVTTQGCSCPNGQHTHKTRFNCYHAVAAELYQRWQRAMQPSLTLPLPPITIDERLAQGSKEVVSTEVVSGETPQQTVSPSSLTTNNPSLTTSQETPMAAPQTDEYTPEPETATPPSPEALKALRLQIIKQLNLYGFKGSSKLDYEEAVMLHVGLVLAPENFPLITERLQQLLDLRASAPPPPKVLKDYMISIHGKDFVQFAGLLALAHERGLQSLKADFVSVTDALALATATATFADGRVFTEAADATPTNVNKGVAAHFARCALTRAKARALRDALNISEVAMEELEA